MRHIMSHQYSKLGTPQKERCPMFELLLLIGFLYAGFFPPTPASATRETHRKTIDTYQHSPDQQHHRCWLVLKKLAQKINDC